jgi:hypothetical protein
MPSPAAWRLSGHLVVKYHDADVGFFWSLPLPVSPEEDKGTDLDE